MTSSPKPGRRRLTRCRTGCMRCRIRRRKCDEGKPRCQNCVDRNFECHYGAQLNFLEKNAQTVEPMRVESTPARYETIRFVNEDPLKDENNDSKEESEDDKQEWSPQRTTKLSAPKESTEATTSPPLWTTGSASHSIHQPIASLISDKDESAVAGLLALGNDTHESHSTPHLPDFVVSPRRNQPGAHPATPLPFPESRAAFSPKKVVNLSSPLSDISDPTESLELMRNYRYNVAPWLDICDLGHLFGIQGLQIAMASEPIWASLITLSKTTMALFQSIPPQSLTIAPSSSLGPDITTTAFAQVLDYTRQYITDIAVTWRSPMQFQTDLMESLREHSRGRSFNSTLYWLFLRHDLGAALASDTSIRIPLPSSPPYPAEVEFGSDPFEIEFCFANRPLWLCARAIKFIHDEDLTPQYPPLHTWMQLMEDLEHWYQGRPPGFQAMLELEMDRRELGLDQTFPIVLFGNGAGVFSNQLYHTAMLILLNNKPRTARIADYHAATMSPLWHAQRICSIALNNERHECWDPCLLASFITAARRMTHETQQQEILSGLGLIQQITGWNFGNLVGSLQNEWGILVS